MKSLHLPREKHFEPPKTSRAPGVLTVLASKSLSRAGVAQILRSSVNFQKCSEPPIFYDFTSQIALARRRGANFVDILGSRSFATPAFRTCFCEPSKPRNCEKHSVSRNSYPPESLMCRICAVKHLCCATSMLWDLAATFSKLELLNFLWTYLPRKAVADVSNHNEPIGRTCGIQLVRKSIDFRFICFELQTICVTNLRTNWLTGPLTKLIS